MREFKSIRYVEGVDVETKVVVNDKNRSLHFYISANKNNFGTSWDIANDYSFPWDDYYIMKKIREELTENTELIRSYISTLKNPNYLETEMANQGFTLISPEIND
jgi:hypothetical protein